MATAAALTSRPTSDAPTPTTTTKPVLNPTSTTSLLGSSSAPKFTPSFAPPISTATAVSSKPSAPVVSSVAVASKTINAAKPLNQPTPVITPIASAVAVPVTPVVTASLASPIGGGGYDYDYDYNDNDEQIAETPTTETEQPFWKKYLPYIIGGGIAILAIGAYLMKNKK